MTALFFAERYGTGLCGLAAVGCTLAPVTPNAGHTSKWFGCFCGPAATAVYIGYSASNQDCQYSNNFAAFLCTGDCGLALSAIGTIVSLVPVDGGAIPSYVSLVVGETTSFLNKLPSNQSWYVVGKKRTRNVNITGSWDLELWTKPCPSGYRAVAPLTAKSALVGCDVLRSSTLHAGAWFSLVC